MLAAPDPHIVYGDDSERILAACSSFRTNQNAEAIAGGKILNSGGEIDAIARHGILEPNIGTHVADHAQAGADADADLHRWYALSAVLGLESERLIQRVEPIGYRKGSFARVDCVVGIVERRVPKRHDGIADILIDRASALDDRA